MNVLRRKLKLKELKFAGKIAKQTRKGWISICKKIATNKNKIKILQTRKLQILNRLENNSIKRFSAREKYWTLVTNIEKITCLILWQIEYWKFYKRKFRDLAIRANIIQLETIKSD